MSPSLLAGADNHMSVCVFVSCMQPNLLTAAADDRWKAIRKAVAVSFSAQVSRQPAAGARRRQRRHSTFEPQRSATCRLSAEPV